MELSNYNLLGTGMIEVTAIDEIILPANKVNFDSDKAIKIHPKAANGETIRMIFFLPIQPEINPPSGVKMIAQK